MTRGRTRKVGSIIWSYNDTEDNWFCKLGLMVWKRDRWGHSYQLTFPHTSIRYAQTFQTVKEAMEFADGYNPATDKWND